MKCPALTKPFPSPSIQGIISIFDAGGWSVNKIFYAKTLQCRVIENSHGSKKFKGTGGDIHSEISRLTDTDSPALNILTSDISDYRCFEV